MTTRAGRSEAIFGIAVAALGIFVGVQVARRPRRTPAVSPVVDTAVAQAGRSATPSTPPHADMSAVVTTSQSTAPDRDIANIRERIIGAPGTYMEAMVADLGGQLIRWPDRRQDGLRVWVQSITSVHDWDQRYAQMARDAFTDWGGGLPLRLDFVFDSASSDIRVVWVDRFPPDAGRRVGTTKRTNDQHGWLVAAQIAVAIHDSLGRVIEPNDLTGIMRHEAGHALGLGHSPDPRTKMYPVELVNEVTPADRATLQLLYQLPPGPIGRVR